MASDEGKKVTLKSSDGEEFLVEEAVAMESQTIRHMIEDGCADDVIPLLNVNSKILSMVIDYCKRHVDEKTAKLVEDAMMAQTIHHMTEDGWPDNAIEYFVKLVDELIAANEYLFKVNKAKLLDSILAANYLNIKGLLDMTCQIVADMIKELPPEEIRKIFESDFTTPEEEEIRRENQWAFE